MMARAQIPANSERNGSNRLRLSLLWLSSGRSSEEGSALPLFLFGVAFLLVSCLVVISASASLLQQRRLNAAADTLALATAQYSLEKAKHDAEDIAKAAQTKAPADVERVAADAAAPSPAQYLQNQVPALYPNQEIAVVASDTATAGKALVRLCQPNRGVMLASFTGGQVCAISRAAAISDGNG